jgi:hypothetical protein
MLSVVMLNVIVVSVDMLSVVAPMTNPTTRSKIFVIKSRWTEMFSLEYFKTSF